ncbi:MAG TPA: hypothetical protein VFZ44_04180 [Pyrinomonadaceae bacterium]
MRIGTRPRSLCAAAALLALAACLLTSAAGSPGQGAGRQRARAAGAARAGTKTASHGGVTFSYDNALASEVKGETIPASPLRDPSEKPDGVAPEHVAFKFLGAYASLNKRSHFRPELHIYPVEDYKRAYAVAPSYAAGVEQTVCELKRAIARRSVEFKDEAPYLDFIDAHQSFQAHVHYLDFHGGKGLAFLTQYDIEPALVTNRGLTYVFQGLTDDGRFYVSATFPVAAHALPAEESEELFRRYGLDEVACAGCPPGGARYRSYLKDISRTLGRTPPARFRPSLNTLDAMLRTLSVQIAGRD